MGQEIKSPKKLQTKRKEMDCQRQKGYKGLLEWDCHLYQQSPNKQMRHRS